MPRKNAPRPGTSASTTDSRVRRPARQLPRPSAAVPLGVEASARPSVERASPPPQGTAARTPYAGQRLVRPARASSLPAILDYGYVFADLRRIGILAAIAFIVLLGLTFVVH
jgi:hypothetical protein